MLLEDDDVPWPGTDGGEGGGAGSVAGERPAAVGLLGDEHGMAAGGGEFGEGGGDAEAVAIADEEDGEPRRGPGAAG